jgi:hypothetical protein
VYLEPPAVKGDGAVHHGMYISGSEDQEYNKYTYGDIGTWFMCYTKKIEDNEEAIRFAKLLTL